MSLSLFVTGLISRESRTTGTGVSRINDLYTTVCFCKRWIFEKFIKNSVLLYYFLNSRGEAGPTQTAQTPSTGENRRDWQRGGGCSSASQIINCVFEWRFAGVQRRMKMSQLGTNDKKKTPKNNLAPKAACLCLHLGRGADSCAVFLRRRLLTTLYVRSK